MTKTTRKLKTAVTILATLIPLFGMFTLELKYVKGQQQEAMGRLSGYTAFYSEETLRG